MDPVEKVKIYSNEIADKSTDLIIRSVFSRLESVYTNGYMHVNECEYCLLKMRIEFLQEYLQDIDRDLSIARRLENCNDARIVVNLQKQQEKVFSDLTAATIERQAHPRCINE